MSRLSSRLRDLTHAEVMTWKLDELEYQVSERQGPVEVWYHEVLIKPYPFFAHWVHHHPTGDLYLFDPFTGDRIGHHPAGSWDSVGHGLHQGILFGRAAG
jgi:hypothetical protein